MSLELSTLFRQLGSEDAWHEPHHHAMINSSTIAEVPAAQRSAKAPYPSPGHHAHRELVSRWLKLGMAACALHALSLAVAAPGGTPPAEIAPLTGETRWSEVRVPPVWLRQGGAAGQPVSGTIRHAGADAEAVILCGAQEVGRLLLRDGLQTAEWIVPAFETNGIQTLGVRIGGRLVAATNLNLGPPRIREMWVLPHSHVDIGYTHRQDEVIDIQVGNLEKGMELARMSQDRPPGMRFKWNPEAIWTLDHYLRRATADQRERFLESVRRGDVGVDGLYANMLTGLCRPEELAQCLGIGTRISDLTGVPVESASICDVPGWTWGLVSMMGQAGIRCFAIGPNFADRVGTIHVWDNRPFYWRSQSGRDRVLCWVVDNYHFFGNLEDHVRAQLEKLDRLRFPYDTSFLFWVGTWPGGGVDNAPPDEATVEKVAIWNAKYAAPRVVIGLTREFFHVFERRHSSRLPEFGGDLTPYWEDGAGSTSRETALNRGSADRLVQAETIFALRGGAQRSAHRFQEAWKQVLLYSEHTWGAWCSISKPDDPFTVDQWTVKAGFAHHADRQSRELLASALSAPDSFQPGPGWIDVFNTTQWRRTDLVTVDATPEVAGVADRRGRSVPSQRLSSGELAFVARDIPPFGVHRFALKSQPGPSTGSARAQEHTLRNGLLHVEIDPVRGEVRSLRRSDLDQEFVDRGDPGGLNAYRYVLGTNSVGALGNGPVTLRVLEAGPLVATLRVESDAPGCERLIRDIRLVDGLDRVEFFNRVDRKSVREKDGVHFGFAFAVPRGEVRMETPWGVVRPDVDQLPGANRNWYTVQRWVEVSNRRMGVTWSPLDAPLMEVGGLTANLLGSVALHEWRTNAVRSSTIYSWAQNNHWHTNYKIDQPGLTTFRYALRPHRGGYSASEAARFGIETSRPLIAGPATPQDPPPGSLFTVSSPDVLVESVKVSDDGQALILRLFGVSGKTERVRLTWDAQRPESLWMTDLTERRRAPAARTLEVPGYGVVSLRAQMRGDADR